MKYVIPELLKLADELVEAQKDLEEIYNLYCEKCKEIGFNIDSYSNHYFSAPQYWISCVKDVILKGMSN